MEHNINVAQLKRAVGMSIRRRVMGDPVHQIKAHKLHSESLLAKVFKNWDILKPDPLRLQTILGLQMEMNRNLIYLDKELEEEVARDVIVIDGVPYENPKAQKSGEVDEIKLIEEEKKDDKETNNTAPKNRLTLLSIKKHYADQRLAKRMRMEISKEEESEKEREKEKEIEMEGYSC